MIDRYTHNSLTWLDVLNPTSEEVRDLIDECSIPPELAGDLTSMTPKTESYGKKGTLKITLDFPVVKRTDIDHPHEIKLIVTKNYLVTIRFEDVEAIHRFGKEFEVVCMLKDKNGKKRKGSSLALFFALLNHLYDHLHMKLDYLGSKVTDIEEGVFSEREKEMVFEISNLTRRLITFRQAVGSHEQALEHLHEAAKSAFTADHTADIVELEHHYRSVNRNLYALISIVEDLRDTNNALLTTKQNEVMKLFTILAFITFPLTLFTSMFGMNTIATPILGHKNDFWIILGIMAVVSITFFAFFKYKRWF